MFAFPNDGVGTKITSFWSWDGVCICADRLKNENLRLQSAKIPQIFVLTFIILCYNWLKTR